MKKLGFSTSVLANIAEPYSKKAIIELERHSREAIEIKCLNEEDFQKFKLLTSEFKHFDYKSLYLPTDYPANNVNRCRKFLDNFVKFYSDIGANLLVIRPDLIHDWRIFNDYPCTWAIENTHLKRPTFKKLPDLLNFFIEHPSWKFVLNINHAYTVDPTKRLLEIFLTKIALKKHLTQIKLSGYEHFYDPLFKTQQLDLLEYCRYTNLPIIIESLFNDFSEISMEYNYVSASL